MSVFATTDIHNENSTPVDPTPGNKYRVIFFDFYNRLTQGGIYTVDRVTPGNKIYFKGYVNGFNVGRLVLYNVY